MAQDRTLNENIRVIDGATFYDLATGETDALRQLAFALPKLMRHELGLESALIAEIETGLTRFLANAYGYA